MSVGSDFLNLVLEGMEEMAKPSKEIIISGLDVRKVPYREDMSYNELRELLEKAQHAEGILADEQKAPPKAVYNFEKHEFKPGGKAPDAPIDYSDIRCGLSTIQDLHRRVTILERIIAGLMARPPVPVMMVNKTDG